MALREWNQACLMKHVWNLEGKADSLWIWWIHSYNTKGLDILNAHIKKSSSWIMKAMLKNRDNLKDVQVWIDMLFGESFSTRKLYYSIMEIAPDVEWKKPYV